MGLPYYTINDAHMRLDNTICFYKGKPYLVRVRDSVVSNKVELNPIRKDKDTKPIFVDYTEKDFVYKPCEIGYVNYCRKAYYFVRDPSRIQKQGMSSEVIYSTNGGLRGSDIFRSSELEKALLDEYPSLNKCLSGIVEDKFYSQAFHRHLALVLMEGSDAVALHHRGVPIAIKKFDTDEFMFLSERSRRAYSILFKSYGVKINV